MVATSRVQPTVGTAAKKQFTGIYTAVVINVNDPLSENRVQLHIPQVLGTAVSNWATPIAMLPAQLGGTPPKVGDVIHAIFNGGDINKPAWVPKIQPVTPPAPTTIPWNTLTLTSGWGNVSGKAAAQYRASGTDSVEIIGNISGGTVTDGTTIATLPSGSRPANGHSFNIAAVTGAQTAPITATTTTGTTSSFTGSGGVNNTPIEASPAAGSQGAYGSLTLANLNDLVSFVDALGSIVNNGLFLGNPAVNVSGSVSSSSSSSTTASANFNSPIITVDTSGNLKITNVNSHVTAISFHHTIPLTA
jgi:hypothetical protein